MVSRVIPNQNTWIGFSATQPAVLEAPTTAELAAATDLTCYVSSLNASAQGNTIPTPSLCSLFETSISGTSQATFSGEFYRDDYQAVPGDALYDDLAWKLLKRGDKGVFFISRFGGNGTDSVPEAGQEVEVWPVEITSRAAGPLSSNTALMFSITCAVNTEPAENALVAA